MNIPRFATLCIPRIDIATTKSYIFEKFCLLNIGFIEKIIEIPICGDQLYKRIIIKLKWNSSDNAKYFMDRFEKGQNVKIVHSDPWFWICIPSRNYEQKINAYTAAISMYDVLAPTTTTTTTTLPDPLY